LISIVSFNNNNNNNNNFLSFIPIFVQFKKCELIFDGRQWSKEINPDEAVAYGSAVQGAIFCGSSDQPKLILLLDVAPLSLGIDVFESLISNLVNFFSFYYND
jgi:molecular chaperone DnaK (HSP70)